MGPWKDMGICMISNWILPSKSPPLLEAAKKKSDITKRRRKGAGILGIAGHQSWKINGLFPFLLLPPPPFCLDTWRSAAPLDSFNLGNRGTCNVVALLDVRAWVYLATDRKTPFWTWEKSRKQPSTFFTASAKRHSLLSSKENWNTQNRTKKSPTVSWTNNRFLRAPPSHLVLHAWWGKSEEANAPQKFVMGLQMVLTGSLSARYAFSPSLFRFIQ